MLWAVEDLAGCPGLDDATRIHHDHPRAEAGDHREVVGDQDDRHPPLAVEIAQQLDDRGLDRNVERGGRLVGDQERGLIRQSHGDHGPLAHATAELVWVVFGALVGGGYAHRLQHRDDPLLRLLMGEALVRVHRFLDLEANPEDRIHRRHRVLEDHGDVAAAKLPELFVVHLEHVRRTEHDAPVHHPTRLRHQPQQRQGGHRLSRAGLAHDPDGLAL